MALSREFVDHVADLFSVLPDSQIRRMFGGMGVFREGLMYALATSEGRVALKVDDATVGDFEAAGAQEWVYRRGAREMRMGYWYVPDAWLEDPATLRVWAARAFEAALRADARKSRRQRKWTGREP